MKKILFLVLFLALFLSTPASADDIYTKIAQQDAAYQGCMRKVERSSEHDKPLIQRGCDMYKAEGARLKTFLPEPAKTETTVIKEVQLSGVQKETMTSGPTLRENIEYYTLNESVSKLKTQVRHLQIAGITFGLLEITCAIILLLAILRKI